MIFSVEWMETSKFSFSSGYSGVSCESQLFFLNHFFLNNAESFVWIKKKIALIEDGSPPMTYVNGIYLSIFKVNTVLSV